MISIIGCGNPVRSDDGAGHHVIQALLADEQICSRKDLQLFDAGTDGMSVMYKARGSQALIIIDACQSGETPGAVFEVPGNEFDDAPPKEQSSHAFRWDHALYAGRRIYAEAFPHDVTVYLIEVETLAAGMELSESVSKAANQVVERIRQKLSGNSTAESIKLNKASLYIPAEVRARYFPNCECVAAIAEGAQLSLAPLLKSAGGHLLKQINPQGDCVVQLQGFFRDQAWNEFVQCQCEIRWDEGRAALSVHLPKEIEHDYATAL